MRIAIASSVLADYPEAGGVWTWALQYLLGLRELGHEPFLVELLSRPDDAALERRLRRLFFTRLRAFDLDRQALLLVHEPDVAPTPENTTAYGRPPRSIEELAAGCDAVWNLAGAMSAPLLTLFRRRALVDVDPGMLQVSALEWDVGLDQYDALLTTGLRIGRRGCGVPTLGRRWHPFPPFVHLPSWADAGPPARGAPVSAVTIWNWDVGWAHYEGQELSASKREAYMRVLDLPRRAGGRFTLAANIHPLDDTGDRETLVAHGWRLVHPDRAVSTPRRYAGFIRRSLAELGCCKPIYRQLRAGWLSDRTVCYLASGRPAICERTGFEYEVPADLGLLAFDSLEEAAEAVARVRAEPERHSHAARRLAEELFDARRVLPRLVELTTG